MDPLTAAFHQTLRALRRRVEQVAGYQLVREGDLGGGEIAHFTKWETCVAMFASAKRHLGIPLWASDADCLNDSLEGKELLLFAEDTVKLIDRHKSPNWATGLYGRQAWERPTFSEADHEDLPHLPEAQWRTLQDRLKELYPAPQASIVATAPRPEPLTGSDVFLVSFCREVDRLDLWRAYTSDADGVCLVMPLADAVRAISKDWRFYRVAYDDRSKARAWALLMPPLETAVAAANGNDSALAAIRKVLAPSLYLFKNEQFRAEREIRLMYTSQRPPHPTVRPADAGAYLATKPFFLGGAGCRAILGPKAPKPHHRASVLRVKHAAMSGNAPFSVERSGVSFI